MTEMEPMCDKKTRVWVRKGLIAQVKDSYHETRGLSASGLVDWALRYVVLLERKLPKPEGKREESPS